MRWLILLLPLSWVVVLIVMAEGVGSNPLSAIAFALFGTAIMVVLSLIVKSVLGVKEE